MPSHAPRAAAPAAARAHAAPAALAILAAVLLHATAAHAQEHELESPLDLRILGYDLTSYIIPLSGSAAAASPRAAHASAAQPQPLRFVISSVDLNVPGKHCSRVGEQSATMTGSSVVCTAGTILTDQRRDVLLKVIIPQATQLHSERLMVRQKPGKIKVPVLDDKICGSFTVPPSYSSEGFDGDMLLLVSSAPVETNAAAWAAACVYGSDKRPTIGVININPGRIRNTRVELRAVVHELAHALGFGLSQFGLFGIPVKKVTIRGKQTQIVTSPNVVREARAHFGCPTMEGMELEDEGGEGTALHHWERRNAKDELMSGKETVGYYSRITLALFQDLGVYTVNYDKAEPMPWGRNAGCGLIDNKCIINGVSQYPDMFRTDSAKNSGTSDVTDCGNCAAEVHTADVQLQFWYFTSSTLGGDNIHFDMFPVIVHYFNGNCDANPVTGKM